MDEHAERKPWYRLRNIVLFVAAVLVLLAGREVYLAITATPGKSVDYGQKLIELAQSLKPGAADDDNALPHLMLAMERSEAALRKAIDANPSVSSHAVDFALLYTPFDPANPRATGNAHGDEADYNMRRDFNMAVLDSCRSEGVFDALAEAARRPLLVYPKQEGRLFDSPRQDFGAIRGLARANVARMRLARQSKDAKEFGEAFEQILGIGRVLTADPILISHLVGLAVAGLGLDEARDAIVAGDLTPEMLRAVADAMDRRDGVNPITHALKGEHLCTLDIIQWTHTDDGNGDGRRIVSISRELAIQSGAPRGLPFPRVANLASALYPSKLQLTSVANDYYAKMEEYAKKTPAERRSASWNPSAAAVTLPWNYDLLRIVLPALERAVTSSDLSRSHWAGTRTLVAIELYRAERGKLPSSLDELVPSYLPEPPRDVLAADGAFKYRILEAPDSVGRAYLLYSVGVDGNDDGANEGDSGWPGQNPGTDAVFNRRKRDSR